MSEDFEIFRFHLGGIIDQDRKDESLEFFDACMRNDFPSLLKACASIILMDDIPITVTHESVILLMHYLNPDRTNARLQLRRLVNDSSFGEILESLKLASCRGLMYQDLGIRTTSGYIVDLVRNLDPSKWPDLWRMLFEILDNSIYDNSAKCGALLAFHEILDSSSPANIPKDGQLNLIVKIMQLITSDREQDTEFYKNCLELMALLIEKGHLIQTEEQVAQILQILNVFFESSDCILLSASCSVLRALCKSCIHTLSASMDWIFQMVAKTLDSEMVENEFFLFWEIVAKEEHKAHETWITSKSAKTVFDEVIRKIDIEDLNNGAAPCLTAMFETCSLDVGDYVLQNFIESKDVTSLVRALDALNCITHTSHGKIVNFFHKCKPTFLKLVESRNTQLSIAALRLLENAAPAFKLFYQDAQDFRVLIQCFHRVSNYPLSVVRHCCYVLRNLFKVTDSGQIFSLLEQIFNDVYNYTKTIIARDDCFVDDFFIVGFEPLMFLVSKAPVVLFKNLIALVDLALGYFATEIENEITVRITMGLLLRAILSQIVCFERTFQDQKRHGLPFSDISDEITSFKGVYVPRIIETFVVTKGIDDSRLYDNATIIVTLCVFLSKDIVRGYLAQVMDLITEGLNSESPEIVAHIIFPLCQLFVAYSEELSGNSMGLLSLLFGFINEKNYEATVSIRFLELIGIIVQRCSNSVAREMVYGYFAVLKSFVADYTDIVKRHNDLSGEFFRVIFSGYLCLLQSVLEDESFLRENEGHFYQIIDLFVGQGEKTESNLLTFYKYLEALSQIYRGSAVKPLNKRTTRDMINEHSNSFNGRILRQSKAILEHLRSFK